MVRNSGGTNEDASDIFQDGLIIMLEKIDNKNFVLTCKFKTYLYCICEHLSKDILDKRTAAENYLVRRDDSEGEKDFTEVIDNQLYEQIFKEVFETIDPVGKSILKMYWQDSSPQEIADKLGYTYNYVRKKKSEAQSELTDKVKQHPGYRRIMKTEMAAREVVH
jgi:RNA polymerase sigma factor (sigma-70 family)